MITTMNKNIPISGFGYYLRRLSNTKDLANSIKRVKDSKATWIALMVESEDGYVNSKSILKSYADAFNKEGVKVWVWTFPGIVRASSVSESIKAAELAHEYCEHVEAEGILLDIEKAYKGNKIALNALVDKTLKLAKQTKNIPVGFVSYPIVEFHKDIDWNCLSRCDFGSPMIYDTSKTKELIDKSYKGYTRHNKVWIPSMATYDTASPGQEEVQLKGDLDRVFEGNGNRSIPGAIFWSESTTSDKERKVIADYSDFLFIK